MTNIRVTPLNINYDTYKSSDFERSTAYYATLGLSQFLSKETIYMTGAQ